MWDRILLLTALCAFLALTTAADVDFKAIDFLASAPYNYDHTYGGGAYNDRTIGEYQDTVESLEGKQFQCEDLVSYMVKIEMEDSVVDANQAVRMQNSWLADTTGQSGVAFIDIVNVELNSGDVENGDNGSGTHPGLGGFGLDGAYNSNGNEILTVNNRWATGPIFQKGSEVRVEWEVSGLEAGEIVIVRFDVVLGCHPDLRKPTGNLQGALNYAHALANDDAIGGGEQTVPLKTVSGVGGLEQCVQVDQEFVGIDFQAVVTISDSSMSNGGFVTSDFVYSWSSGAYVISSQNNPTKTLHTFDTICTVYHDGEYLFSQGLCGCEETFIGADQPQLFFDSNSNYYNPNPTTEIINGIQVYHYTRSTTDQAITDLYLAVSNGNPVRAVWEDGRVMDFAQVTLLDIVDPATFESPAEECTCKRRLDLALVIEKSGDVIPTQWDSVKLFAADFSNSYEIDPAHTQMTIIEFAETSEVILPINEGSVLNNVLAGVNSLSCPASGGNGNNGGGACGSGDASIPAAIDGALAELATSSRGAAASQAIVIVTNGWQSTQADVEAAVGRANDAGVIVYTVAYSTTMLTSELSVITLGDPDLLILRYNALDLGAIDTIDINSRVCLANSRPCGDECCGHCDTTCGDCIPVDDCNPDTTGCIQSVTLVGSCCKLVTSIDTCEAPVGECGISVCNANSDQCEFTPTCVDDPNDNCHIYVCENGQCTKNFIGDAAADACNIAKCVNNAIDLVAVNCGSSDACNVVSCDPVDGCITTPVDDPNPSSDVCVKRSCDSQSGWIDVPVTCDSDQTPCTAGSCDTNTGNCVFISSCVDDAANLCVTKTCGPADACNTDSVVCDPVPCKTLDPAFDADGGCNPATGQCAYIDTVCQSTACLDTVCMVQPNGVGACEEIPTIGCDCNCENTVCRKTPCDPVDQTCMTTVDVDCANLVPDTCHTADGPCDPVKGCTYTPIDCTQVTPPDNCQIIVKDPTAPGCCIAVPKPCSGDDLCATYTCLDGACVSTGSCDDSDVCSPYVCTATGCEFSPVVCDSPPNECYVGSCDATTGECVYSDGGCDDGDACTVDECVDGVCTNTLLVCDDSNECTNDHCNPNTGKCEFSPPTCDDDISCTLDTCSNGSCTHVPTHDLCDDGDPCSDYVCTVDGGCSSTPRTCLDEDGDFCTEEVCIEYVGCTAQTLDCYALHQESTNANSVSDDCKVHYCNADDQKCAVRQLTCGGFSVGEIAAVAGVGTAVIVGIVVAIVVALGCGGGAVYAVYTKNGVSSASVVANNPLYQGTGASGVNPLNRA